MVIIVACRSEDDKALSRSASLRLTRLRDREETETVQRASSVRLKKAPVVLGSSSSLETRSTGNVIPKSDCTLKLDNV